MLQVGITGGIGSGKSLISKIFNSLGHPVFNSDAAAKYILMNDTGVKEQLLNHFGKEIFTGGQPDRVKLGEKVFADEAALTLLNSIIHPLVKVAYEKWLSEQKAFIVFKEAAILIETGNYRDLDKLIVVSAPAGLRIRRIMQRDKLSEAEVLQRMKNQLSDDERNSFADFILINDEHHAVIPQVLRILDELKSI